MRDVAEYRKRAEDSRQQALKLATQSEAFSRDGPNLGTTRRSSRTEREAQSAKRVLLTKPAVSAE
jgi:hypothetical protein